MTISGISNKKVYNSNYHTFNYQIIIIIFFSLKKKQFPYVFLDKKNGGVYGYIKPPDRAHTLKDVMPTNRLLLVAGIEPEHVRQSERTIPN